MNICKYTIITLIAVLVAGCSIETKKVIVVKAPLIIADALPIISATKRSVGVRINFENITANDYNYARFKVTAYNSDGENISPKKGNKESAYLRIAGPITAGSTKSSIWTNTWNSKGVNCISLDEVELIFMDGSIEIAKGNRLLNKQKGNKCM